MKVGEIFSFEVPQGWEETRKGMQHIFSGPNDEVLIISGLFFRGPDGPELVKAVEQAKQDVFSSIRFGAQEPSLREIAPLSRWKEITQLETWWQLNITHDKTVVFSQVAMISGRGVLFATLESPTSELQHPQILLAFAKSVYAIG